MRLWYVMRESLTDLRGHRGTVLIGVVTTAFTISCFGGFVLLYLNLKNLAAFLQNDVQVIVYVDPDASVRTTSGVNQRLEREPAATAITFVSKERALREFHEQFPDESTLLDGMGSNPLPASFVVNVSPRFQDAESLGAFADRVRQFPGVTHVRYSQDWIDTLALVVSHFELGAVVIGTILAVATVTIITNTVRLSFYARREEIEILRLIGATGAFIAVPYVIEGAILGTLGGLLSLGMLKGTFELLRFEIGASGWFRGMDHVLTFFSVPVSMLVVLTGMLLGCGSSLVSVFGLIKTRD